ncbi:CRE-SRX-48 protein [Caenorhabditis remanei]|uniref:CRE-SRX-48 protein n=1 Tax=Caenorhabditis remanei TaxID=31234 RepID=E3MBS3_CAERE|nr:CRE-SRX-48 protein [Caenorhabditis remanei]
MFTFATTPICVKIVWYADFLKYNSIVVFIVIIDVITVSKVRSYKAHLAKTSSKAQSSRRQSTEMNFLKQTCLQAVVFVCELITYFIISPKVDPSQRWLIFSLTTFAWVCVHMLDGIITLTFNKEFTQIIFRGRNTVADYGVSRSNLEATSNAASATKY